MDLVLILFIIWAVTFLILGLVVFIMLKGVGTNLFWTFFSARMKKRKGFGLARIYSLSGFPKYYVVDMKKETFKLKLSGNDKEGLYNLRHDCILFNQSEIPEVMFSPNDSDPFNPSLGLPTVTDPEVQQSTIARLNSAEATFNDGFEFIRNNWWKLAIMILGIAGIMGFIILHQTDQMVVLATQNAKTVVVGNISGLGK